MRDVFYMKGILTKVEGVTGLSARGRKTNYYPLTYSVDIVSILVNSKERYYLESNKIPIYIWL